MDVALGAKDKSCTTFCSIIVSTLFFMALCIGSQIGAYYLATLYGVQMNDADDDDPVIQMGSSLCKKFDKKIAFNNHSIVQIGLSVPFFGAYIGVLLQSKLLNGQKNMAKPKKKKLWKGIGRFVVLVALSMPFVLMVLLVDFGENVWYNMLRFAIPFFLWNLVLTFMLDDICLKCKLYENVAD